MTQVTADLEFFKCDVCLTYFHRDIFCDHRRHCKGAGSTELNTKQADKIAATLDSCEARRRAAAGGPAAPVATLEQTKLNKTRGALAKATYEAERASLRAQLQCIDADALMAELNAE